MIRLIWVKGKNAEEEYHVKKANDYCGKCRRLGKGRRYHYHQRLCGKRNAGSTDPCFGGKIFGNRITEESDSFLCGCSGKPGRQRCRPFCPRGNDQMRHRRALEHGAEAGGTGSAKQDRGLQPPAGNALSALSRHCRAPDRNHYPCGFEHLCRVASSTILPKRIW